ncbi:MFS transporter [Paenibacillus sp.]|uniref:MFS transporter n=1 Tax=Paenibacillus sp. TaxID=58172 RepID=UPI002D49D8F2|nr:MFS transporter [Paenibacillus sp.]HZG86075.1 MFS transporter [Paenibacillus sp.]
MEVWKRNLTVLWTGNFLISVGMSIIIPFLAIYVLELGVTDVKEAAIWSSFIFAINHVMLALFSPMWGRLSDKYGQKRILIVSGIGMCAAIVAMGLVGSPWGLLALRGVFGTMGGFGPAASALVAVETPKESLGKSLGSLQTSGIAGQLIGPLAGGILASTIGMRSAFFITGFLMAVTVALVIAFVKETTPRSAFAWKDVFRTADAGASGQPSAAGGLAAAFRYPFVPLMLLTTMLLFMSTQSIEPIMTLYVQSAIETDHVEIVGGLVFGVSAVGTLLTAPLFGRWGDRKGFAGIIVGSLALLAIVYALQPFVHQTGPLLALRFLAGVSIGGLFPSLGACLRRLTPKEVQGSVFGANAGAMSVGCVLGSLFGGFTARWFGFDTIFNIVAVLLLLHAALLAVVWRKRPMSARFYESDAARPSL